MRSEILINNVIKELDELILKFDFYYTTRNLKKTIKKQNHKIK